MKVNMGQPNDLLLDDLELILREIDEFNTALINNKPVNIPQSLENYLQFVAKSGNTVFPWPHVRNLIRTKMVNAIQQFQEPTCPNESFVLERFDLFRLAAPFTVQRLTELILQPTRHYRKKEKFLRGLEKTVLVVSTIEPHSLTNDEEKNGNDISNTSSSSCEAETEIVAFNRTITLDSHDLLTVRTTSSVDLIPHESVVIDPVAVTTTTVATHVDVINQNITITSACSIISENVITSAISSDEVITPDKVPVVSSLDVASDSDTLTTSTGVSSMDSSEAQDILTTSLEVMEEGTTENMTLEPISSAVGTTVDVVSQNICVSSIGTIPENVTTSTVHSVDVIIPDKVIDVPSEPVVLNTAEISSDTCVSSMNPVEAQDILATSHDVIEEGTSENMALDPISTAVDTTVDVVSQNICVPPVGTVADNVTTSSVHSVDLIIPEKVPVVSSDAVSLDGESDPLANTSVSSENSGEAQGILSTSLEVMEEGASETVTLDPISTADVARPNICGTTSIETVPENVTTSTVHSVDVIIPDKGIDVSSESVVLNSAEVPTETSANTTTAVPEEGENTISDSDMECSSLTPGD